MNTKGYSFRIQGLGPRVLGLGFREVIYYNIQNCTKKSLL